MTRAQRVTAGPVVCGSWNKKRLGRFKWVGVGRVATTRRRHGRRQARLYAAKARATWPTPPKVPPRRKLCEALATNQATPRRTRTPRGERPQAYGLHASRPTAGRLAPASSNTVATGFGALLVGRPEPHRRARPPLPVSHAKPADKGNTASRRWPMASSWRGVLRSPRTPLGLRPLGAAARGTRHPATCLPGGRPGRGGQGSGVGRRKLARTSDQKGPQAPRKGMSE